MFLEALRVLTDIKMAKSCANLDKITKSFIYSKDMQCGKINELLMKEAAGIKEQKTNIA